MIPSFPEFKKLELTDKEDIEKITWNYPPYSDFNFVSMYSYNTSEKIEISILNGNLVLLFEDYIDGSPFFTFFGENNITETIEILVNEAEKKGITKKLSLIPEFSVLPILENKEFVITEDPDNHDYILSIQELSEFAGNKFYDKRNLVNRFKNIYPEYETRTLDLNNSKIQEEIIELFYTWEKLRNKKREETEHELIAINRLLEANQSFKLLAQGIYHDNKMIAFTIKEVIQKNYAIVHFEKCNISFDGISSILRQESAKFLRTHGCEFLNFEQDLGIEGLKKAKQLWRPVHFLKKYTITKSD